MLADTNARCGSRRAASASAATESSWWAYVRRDLSMRGGRAAALCGLPRASLRGAAHEPVELVRRPLNQVTHLAGRLLEAAEHVCRDDLGIRRVGPAHSHPDAPEVTASEPSLERLEAVVAGEAAAQTALDAPERQVDLVMDGDHVIEVDAQRAASRADRVARLVHVGLREQHGGAAGLAVEAAVLLLQLADSPAVGRELHHLEADVVPRAGVALARVAEPDDQPVRPPAAAATPAPTPRSRPSRPLGAGHHSEPSASSAPASPAASASSPVAPSAAASASASSPTSSVSSSISGSSTSVGTTTVAMIVSSRSSRKTTPSGGVTSERCIVAAISMPDTSTVTFSGIAVGSASMLSWWVTCSSTPPSFTPGASSPPSRCTLTCVWIFSSSRTSSRSMWISSSRTGWR